ncbi:Nramp family divalent metal transporter [Patescibacteria group bacterium]
MKDLPKPPSLRKLLGPSFILLGLGLGSGELILWPYLASRFGMGIIWGAILGITFQFFINMEIERYALITGESIFVGLARKLKKVSPVWFIVSTIIPWMWPGIVASSAVLLASIFGIKYSPIIPIALLVFIGIVLTLGPIIYKTQEVFQRTLVLVSVPFIFILAIIFAKAPDWQALAHGIIGKGIDFWFLPSGISLAAFLGAFAYSGAGGNLNLAQSFYIKEKGYGMGKFSGRITSILTGKKENLTLKGTTFKITPKNLKRFKAWWRRINIEHALVFWATGALTMVMLSFLAYTTVFNSNETIEGIGFILKEGLFIGQHTLPFVGIFFVLIAALMLFSTQFSILDATSRILSENIIIFSPKVFKISSLPKYYYTFLWLQISLGVLIFSLGVTQPFTLIVIGAVLNAIAMFVFSGLVLWLNKTRLKKPLRPNFIRSFLVIFAIIFYGVFSAITVSGYIFK